MVLGDESIFFYGDMPMPFEFAWYNHNRFELRPVLEGVEVFLYRTQNNVLQLSDKNFETVSESEIEEEDIMILEKRYFPEIGLDQVRKAKIVLEEE